MIKLPPGIETEAIPIEKRYKSNLKGLLTRIRKLYEAIEDRFGEEGLNPDLDYVIEKCIPRGDSKCWHVLKLRTLNKV